MDELSDRARAYLDAFAKQHRAPAVVPPLRPLTAVKAASWLRWLLPTVGMAAVIAAGWSAGRAGTIEVAGARRFEAAPHHATVPAIEERTPTLELRSVALHARQDVAVAEPVRARPRVRPASSTLREELAMLDAAKTSLRAGDRDAALRDEDWQFASTNKRNRRGVSIPPVSEATTTRSPLDETCMRSSDLDHVCQRL
jgi:hypothetical protein